MLEYAISITPRVSVEDKVYRSYYALFLIRRRDLKKAMIQYELAQKLFDDLDGLKTSFADELSLKGFHS